jgi:peptide/nickel transport system ATP-binding protein
MPPFAPVPKQPDHIGLEHRVLERWKRERTFETLRRSYFPQDTGAAWDERVADAVHSVGLVPGEVLGKFPHQLSGGQLQRLLVARALLLDLRLLVADEIISMLDASTRIDVLNLLGELKTRGLGILFITHDLSLGNYISDRAVIMRRGAVVEMGSTERVFGNPLHPYTRALLASVPQLHTKWADAPQLPPVDEARGPLVQVEDDHFVAA